MAKQSNLISAAALKVVVDLMRDRPEGLTLVAALAHAVGAPLAPDAVATLFSEGQPLAAFATKENRGKKAVLELGLTWPESDAIAARDALEPLLNPPKNTPKTVSGSWRTLAQAFRREFKARGGDTQAAVAEVIRLHPALETDEAAINKAVAWREAGDAILLALFERTDMAPAHRKMLQEAWRPIKDALPTERVKPVAKAG